MMTTRSRDGFSGSGGVGPNFAYTSGRTQFQPEIAVDQATGTLVLSWRDARDDAANARVATYITTSIDGGQTFSPETYANPQNTATDAITGQTDVLGPMADNQSAGNPQVDAGFGYGDQMGLAVFDGQVFPVWAGNLNQSFVSNNVVIADPLNVWVQPMAIAAGPRIINSSMGPIPLAEAASGVVSISVTFDRAINPNTFGTANVQVFYHDTNKADGYVSLQVFERCRGVRQWRYPVHDHLQPDAHRLKSGDVQLHRDVQLPDFAGRRPLERSPSARRSGRSSVPRLRSGSSTRWTRMPTARPTRTR